MNRMLHSDERRKFISYLLIFFLVQGILFYALQMYLVSQVNQRYLTQNLSMIGKLYQEDDKAVENVIPIIIGKETGDYEMGKQVMKQYSYDIELPYSKNPLFVDMNESIFVFVIVLACVSVLTVIFLFSSIMKPLYQEIEHLTNRASNIVENKFTTVPEIYRGSLDKFIDKFSKMEERIKNNLDQLQLEKINLKNIINDISHQLKTPLTALSMYNDILMSHQMMEEKEIDEFLALSSEQLERMDWLVKTLLKYARLESNVVEYHKQDTSLVETINESLLPLYIKAEEKQQELSISYEHDVFYYHDKKWVAEAISNIAKNAIEHTGVNGKIEIILATTPVSIIIRIRDNGEGISEKEMKRIFERFHKGENSINPTSIGIGLCLSKSIIEAHSGDISVESKVGQGSTFSITFLKNPI